MARLTALLAAALVATGAASGAADAATGAGIVLFSVFSGLPPFQGHERCEGLCASRADGSGLTRLTAPDAPAFEGHYWPSLAPSGRVAVFGFFARRSGRDLAVRLFALDLPSGRARGLERSDIQGAAVCLREPPPRPFSPGGEFEVGDLYRLEVATGRARPLTLKVIPLDWARNGTLLLLRPRTASGELVFAIVVRSGTRERVVGVTDEEDVNIGSYPAWQPRRAPVRAAGLPFGPPAAWGFCLDRLRALRTEIAR